MSRLIPVLILLVLLLICAFPGLEGILQSGSSMKLRRRASRSAMALVVVTVGDLSTLVLNFATPELPDAGADLCSPLN